jgi:hypothetical protein
MQIGDPHPFLLGQETRRDGGRVERFGGWIRMRSSILYLGPSEPPTGSGLSTNSDGPARVVVVPTLLHQLKVAGLLLSRTRHAGQLQRRRDWMHGGLPGACPVASFPRTPGQQGGPITVASDSAGDPLYSARRTLSTGADLLTEKQQQRISALYADTSG